MYYQSPEWNTAAVGPTKRVRADELIHRLRERFAPRRVPASRSRQVVSRGKPAALEFLALLAARWQADLAQPGIVRQRKTEGPTGQRLPMPKRWRSGIAGRLGVGGTNVIAAYEDSMHWTLKEAQLPDNVDPLDSKLESAEERARIARVFERGLTKPSGYVLPIQRWQSRAGQGWGQRSVEIPPPAIVPDPRRFHRSVIDCLWRRCPGFRRKPIRR